MGSLAFWLWVGFGPWQVLAGKEGVGRKQGQAYGQRPPRKTMAVSVQWESAGPGFEFCLTSY